MITLLLIARVFFFDKPSDTIDALTTQSPFQPNTMGSDDSLYSTTQESSHDSFEQSPQHRRKAAAKRKHRDVSSDEKEISWTDNEDLP